MSDKKIRNTTIALAGAIVIGLMFNFFIGGFVTWPWFKAFDASATGQFGDFVGGVIGTIINAAAFYFLYLTLQEQKIATNEQVKATRDQKAATTKQREAFELERFESKFFELVKFHRENILEIEFLVFEKNDLDDDTEVPKETHLIGRKVFRAIFEQFMECRNEIKPYFHHKQPVDIYKPDYLAEVKALRQNNKLDFDLSTLAKINVAYSIIFYGCSAEGISILERLFSSKYKSSIYRPILNYLRLKPKVNAVEFWSLWRSVYRRRSFDKKILIINYIYRYRHDKTATINLEDVSLKNDNFDFDKYKNYKNNYKKYYGGHQFRLGHYYRHLYQTVKFVDRYPGLDDNQRYSYIKILRAQLSTYEQALLFFNSLSSLGLIWELNPDIQNLTATTGLVKRKLITKYNLIKNLPTDELYGIRIKDFYPDVNYEQH